MVSKRIFTAVYGRIIIIILCCLSFKLTWATEEDADLELIPEQLIDEPAIVLPLAQSSPLKIFIEETVQFSAQRKDLSVPLPVSNFADWYNRFSIDTYGEWQANSSFKLILSNRLYHYMDEQNDITAADIHNDLKELYGSWQLTPHYYIDAGRINLKSGVALGFNPTDFFKTGAARTRLSEDPAILRENRLGAVMARLQGLWEKAAASLAFAPDITEHPDRWWNESGSAGLTLNRTNTEPRLLLKTTLHLATDFSPEFLYYWTSSQKPAAGFNLSRTLNTQSVAFIEWSGQNRLPLAAQALRQLGLPPLLGTAETQFFSQLALGFSYTEKDYQRATTVEYHYNQAGFDEQDWAQWFLAGQQRGVMRQAQLWHIRRWAREAQQPLSRHSFFIRSFWENVLSPKLDLSGLLNIPLSDRSFFIQPQVDYQHSDNVVFSLNASFFVGSKQSEYGSLPEKANWRAEIRYYF